MPSQHAMSSIHAHVEGYEPAVNDLTSLWTKKTLLKIIDLNDTSLQVNESRMHFTLE